MAIPRVYWMNVLIKTTAKSVTGTYGFELIWGMSRDQAIPNISYFLSDMHG